MRTPPSFVEFGDPLPETGYGHLVEAATFARVEILIALALFGPLSNGGLCSLLGRRGPYVSDHLRVLRIARLVACEHRGKNRIYSLAPAARPIWHGPDIYIELHATRGATLLAGFPEGSTDRNSLAPAVLERLRSVALTKSPLPDGEAPVPPGHEATPSRPASAPGPPSAPLADPPPSR